MRMFNWLLIVALTVNGIFCDSTIATPAVKPMASSCYLNNSTDISKIKSICGDQTVNLFFKDSHFAQFPHIFELYPNLQSVDISYTGIQHIESTTFDNAIHLTSLDMDGSNISTLANDLFSHVNNLTSFEIANSSIVTIEPHAFHGLSNLKKLDLSFNRIRKLVAEIFQPLSRLEHIRISNNQIEVIDGDLFERNTNLKWAYFNSNKIVVIDPNSFIHCQIISLDLGCNQLQGVDLATMKYLKELTVANNNLNTLIIPSNADEIHAENNSIAVIRADDKNELTKLILSSNRLLNLQNLANLGKLSYVDLSNNHLQSIDFTDLKALTQLKELKLTGNKLSEIKIIDVISNLPKLAMIELSTKHWSDEYTNKLKDDLQSHKIVLGQDRSDVSENDTKIVTPVPSSGVTDKSTTTTRSPDTNQTPGSDEKKFEEINRRLNDVEHKLDSNAATNAQKMDDRLSDMQRDLDDKLSKTNAKYDALASTFKTYEALLIIMFISGLMVVLYKVVVYSKNMLNGMRYRRAQSRDPIFSEQDL